MTKLKPVNEFKLGGLFLILGSILLLGSIFFEYHISWIGIERTENEVPKFIYENWQDLKLIWRWQMLAHFVLLIAYFLLLKDATAIMRTLWSVLLVCSLMMLIAFGFTLGSYYPALEVYNSQPEIFETISGGIGWLYQFGRMGLLIFFLVFLLELFGKNGKVSRGTGILILCLVVLSIVLGFSTGISVKVTGAAFFLLPMTLGYYYFRNKDF